MALRASSPSDRTRATRRPRRVGWLRGQWLVALVGALLGGGLAYGYVAYWRSADVSPDSRYGYLFAIAGTTLLALTGIGYTLRKRLWRGRLGLLHTALSWHIVGGLLGLAFILAHSVGNFNPRTGTYALYSLIALVVSGVIGKQLDRVAPRLAARAALKTLTADGDERIDALVGSLTGKRQKRRERERIARQQHVSSAPWDIAYYDLGATHDEIPALLNRRHGDSVRATSPATSALASESSEIRQAIGIERLCLRLIRVWRYLHTALSVLTLALILWHLEFAATLLLAAR